MEKQLLREQEIFPSEEVLRNILGNVYDVYEELETLLTQDGITFEWHYYKDSKSWLCKVAYKKKTVFWLSIWEGFFKTSFFFLERHLEGIATLEIPENSYVMEKEWGKMIPFIFSISKCEQLTGLIKMINLKKGAK